VVSPERATSTADGFTMVPKANADDMEGEDEEPDSLHAEAAVRPSHRPTRKIKDVMSQFSSTFSGDIDGKPARSGKARRAQLYPVIDRRLARMGPQATLPRAILDYARHLLDRNRAPSTILKIYHRLSLPLAGIPHDMELAELTSEDLTGLLMASLHRSSRRDKSDVLAELRRFGRFVVNGYGAQEPDWALLAATYGMRYDARDPAVLADHEVERLFAELERTLDAAQEESPDPVELRCRQLQLFATTIADASGARPASIHGLTLADIHFTGEGDYIHLRSRGKFASIKSATAAGFVLLEGESWMRRRDAVIAWVRGLREAHSAISPEHVPLFQVPGQVLGVRYQQRHVFGRVSELMRWTTQQSRGRTYWFRKRRVDKRHRSVLLQPRPRARDVARIMKMSGHAGIITPVASYLGDPVTHAPARIGAEVMASATRSARLAGEQPNSLVMRWKRLGRASTDLSRMAAILDLDRRLPTPDHLPAPAPYVPRKLGFSWSSVARVLEVLADGHTLPRISSLAAVTDGQAARISGLAAELEIRLGRKLGRDHGCLAPPRPTHFSRALSRMVDDEDGRLGELAAEWVSVATRVNWESGCPLLAGEAMLRSVLADLGRASARARSINRIPVYGIVGKDGEEVYGGWQALRWALSVAWVATKLGMRRATNAPRHSEVESV
jgi:hypothetical protein